MSDQKLDVIGKLKYILSSLPASPTLKQKLESTFTQYNNRDDEDTLKMLIVRAYDLIVNNQELFSKSDTMYQHSESNTKCMKQISIQSLLNDTLDELDGLLAEYINESDHFAAFDDVKKKLRQLFNHLEERICTLEKQVKALQSHASNSEEIEKNANFIQMGNIATQLRNKMVRYIKPSLTKRAARDEYLYALNGEGKFSNLTALIQTYNPSLTVFDLARSINALTKERADKAHDEQPLSSDQIDSIAAEFISNTDEYLGEQATTVIFFLKVLAEQLHEPLIVTLK